MFTAFLPPDPDPRARSITSLAEDRSGTIWAGTMRGVYRLDQTAGRPTMRAVEIGIPNEYSEQAIVNDLLVDRRGSLWIAAPSGLYRVWPDGMTARYTKRDGLPDEFLPDLLEDHTGALWAGTRSAGFFRFAAPESREPPMMVP